MSQKKVHKHKLHAIDFFCGAGGMTSGFQHAGIPVIAGIDFDIECKNTYESNNPNSKFVHADIKKLSYKGLEKQVSIKKNDDNLVFIGCSPCQYWSKIKTDKKKSEESKNLLIDFQKFVHYYKPGYVVIENVPGILTKSHETPLTAFLKFLTKNNYYYDKAIINASHFGVPQTRRRFLLIATRVKDNITLPQPDTQNIPTVRQFISEQKGFPKISAGTKDTSEYLHSTAGLSEVNLLRLKNTPTDGGTRLAYYKNKKLAIPTQYKSKLFSDTYGRMFWDKPAPTITTKFLSISNGRFAHPEQNRAISLREGATLQTFDKTYKFIGNSLSTIARQIGNAVPPELSKRIAKSIIESASN